MSVTVFLKTNPVFDGSETAVAELFDDTSDQYYWALEPVFQQVEKRCGVLIDQYGTVVFPPDSLAVLREELHRALEALSQRPESWQVSIGTEVLPDPKELKARVYRAEVLRIVTFLISLSEEATQRNAYLAFSGD